MCSCYPSNEILINKFISRYVNHSWFTILTQTYTHTDMHNASEPPEPVEVNSFYKMYPFRISLGNIIFLVNLSTYSPKSANGYRICMIWSTLHSSYFMLWSKFKIYTYKKKNKAFTSFIIHYLSFIFCVQRNIVQW